MYRKIGVYLFAVFALFWQFQPAYALDDTVLFYLDESYAPVVRLDRLPQTSEAMKAILALYALENGAGCEGKNEQGLVKCALTRELGLGANCSDDHIRFVRSWFKVIPNLTSRWTQRWNADSQQVGSLEDLCYDQPDSASWHNIWEIIRVSSSNGNVTVDAIQNWGSQYGHGRIHYINTYVIERHTISEVSSVITKLDESSESIFGDE